MFFYALYNLGFDSLNKYVEYIKTKNIYNEKELIELTFTSINFEILSVMYGIEIINKYLTENLPEWRDKVENGNPDHPITKIYIKQIQPEYVARLEDKLRRYTIKYELLMSIKDK